MPGDTRVKTFVALVTWVGFTVLLVSLLLVPLEQWEGILIFAVLCGIAQTMPIYLFRSSAVSVSFAFTFAGLVLFGPAAAIWINVASGLVAAFRPKRKPLYKVFFNLGNHAIATGVAGFVYLGAGGTIQPDRPLTSILPALAGGAAAYLVQTSLLSGAIALSERVSLRQTWEHNFQWSVLNFLSLAVVGLGMSLAQRSLGLLGIAIFFIPLGIAWHSFRLYMDKSKEVRLQNETLKLTNEKLEASYLSTIRALAAAVDVKDHYTHGHSEQVMRYAVAMGRRLGLGDDAIASVQVAALFHDLGKIGVPDSILNKTESLSAGEWKVIREHPVVGAKIVQQVSSLSAVVPGILYHHERHDGKGYPSGFSGDNIPVAAQIISVADAFQAMTSSRPYRSAFGWEAAIEELRRGAGTQFNPRVVSVFIEALEAGETTQEVALPSLLRLFQSLEGKGVYVHAN